MSNITKKQILKICKTINKQVENINCGGCGVFAYLMGTALNKFDNCNTRVRVVSYSNKPKKDLNSLVPENRNETSEWNRNGVYFNHIVLEVTLNNKVFNIDSNGIYKDDNDTLIDGSIPVHFIKRIVSGRRGWNSWFDRTDIPLIAKSIRKFTKESGLKTSSLFVSNWVLG